MVWGYISAYGMGNLHFLEGTMNAERYIKVLEQHMLPSRRCQFQGRPCAFQHDNAKPHTAAITTAWLRSKSCSPDLSHVENIWGIIKQKIYQRRPQTLQQLETHIRQEWDQIPIPKLQKLQTNSTQFVLYSLNVCSINNPDQSMLSLSWDHITAIHKSSHNASWNSKVSIICSLLYMYC